MNWFYEKQIRPSGKNGKITVIREFGRWQVSVKDCGQTTTYTHHMWIDAYGRLKKIADLRNIKKVLLLGLGAGGEVKLIYKTFKGCVLTVVEYDEEMIKLTQELKLYKPYPLPNILLGDAAQIVPTLQEKYDLIIVDLFNGPEPSPLSSDESFVGALAQHCAPNGHVFFNIYKRPEYLEMPKRFFANHEQWMWEQNNLGLFSGPKSG